LWADLGDNEKFKTKIQDQVKNLKPLIKTTDKYYSASQDVIKLLNEYGVNDPVFKKFVATSQRFSDAADALADAHAKLVQTLPMLKIK